MSWSQLNTHEYSCKPCGVLCVSFEFDWRSFRRIHMFWPMVKTAAQPGHVLGWRCHPAEFGGTQRHCPLGQQRQLGRFVIHAEKWGMVLKSSGKKQKQIEAYGGYGGYGGTCFRPLSYSLSVYRTVSTGCPVFYTSDFTFFPNTDEQKWPYGSNIMNLQMRSAVMISPLLSTSGGPSLLPFPSPLGMMNPFCLIVVDLCISKGNGRYLSTMKYIDIQRC